MNTLTILVRTFALELSKIKLRYSHEPRSSDYAKIDCKLMIRYE